MNMQSIEDALVKARGYGSFAGEFEALQDVVTALLLRHRIFVGGPDPEFYSWYINRLIDLYEAAVAQHNRNSPSYHLSRNENTIIARIKAALATAPEVIPTDTPPHRNV